MKPPEDRRFERVVTGHGRWTNDARTIQPPREPPIRYGPREPGTPKAAFGAIKMVHDTAELYGRASEAVQNRALDSLKDQIEAQLPQGFEGFVVAEPGDYQTGSLGYGDNHYSKVTVTPGKAVMYDPEGGTRVIPVTGKNSSLATKSAFSQPGATTFTVAGPSGNPTTVEATHHERIDLVDRAKVRDVPADSRFDKGYKDQLDKVREPYRDPIADSGDTMNA